MLIRAPQQADLPAISQLWLEQANLLAILSPKYAQSIAAPAKWVAALDQALSDPLQQVILAENTLNVLGFLWVKAEPEGSGSVVAISVEMHGHGSAVGAALWSQARNWFHLQGVSLVLISSQSAIADAFWLAHGAVMTPEGLTIRL